MSLIKTRVRIKRFINTNGALFGMATTSIDKAMLEGSARLDDNEEYGSELL